MYLMVKDDSPKTTLDAKAVREAMDALLAVLPTKPRAAADALTNQRRAQLRKAIGKVVEALHSFHVALDPVRHPQHVFDPSDPQIVGQLIADTLLVQPRRPLAEIAADKFYGSGVYAVYYRGSFDAYQQASGTDTPLYVGKVDPQKPGADTVEDQGLKLYGRLVNDHARSIHATENLDVEDFDCRYLVVKSAWQNTAETYLIERFHPIWNNEVGICFGIGKHGDSAKTRGNTRSPWDTLHPGRKWAWQEGNKPNPLSPEEIKARIALHYQQHPPMK
jgi:hypothetical protein